MAVKQRAIALEDKEERRHALLDAAEALFLEHPDRMASVAEVAQAAGVAKGTVYLYFPSKEEMLLALHERHTAEFFAALMKVLDGRRAGFDDIWAATLARLVRRPGYLSLTSRCFGLMDRDIPRKRRSPSRCAWGRRWRRPGRASSGTSRRWRRAAA